jgi:predicted acylesterase/phospholipase RssA
MFTTIVLSGGGINGYCHLGFLDYLQRHDKTRYIETIYGTSIGAVIGLLYIIGFEPRELYDILVEIDSREIFSLSDVDEFFTKYGFDSGEYFMAHIVDILTKKMVSPIITFLQLKQQFKKSLIICGTNVTLHAAEYFSAETHADMKLLDALRITISIPFLFSAVSYKDNLYIDGFATDNYPLNKAIHDFNISKPFHQNNLEKYIIGCLITSMNPKQNDTIENYIFNMFACFRKKEHVNNYTVYITLSSSPIQVDMTISEKKDLFDKGYDYTNKYMQHLKCKSDYKRRSI